MGRGEGPGSVTFARARETALCLSGFAVAGALLDLGADTVGSRVGAEEAYVVARPVQSHQGLAHPGLGDVALAVDREAVAAQTGTGRTRLDPREVAAAQGEFLEQFEEQPGEVGRASCRESVWPVV